MGNLSIHDEQAIVLGLTGDKVMASVLVGDDQEHPGAKVTVEVHLPRNCSQERREKTSLLAAAAAGSLAGALD